MHHELFTISHNLGFETLIGRVRVDPSVMRPRDGNSCPLQGGEEHLSLINLIQYRPTCVPRYHWQLFGFFEEQIVLSACALWESQEYVH